MREALRSHRAQSAHLALLRHTGPDERGLPNHRYDARGKGGGVSTMSRIRLLVLYGPASLDPYMMGWPLRPDSLAGVATSLDADRAEGWFVWRLAGGNNRELGRSVTTFSSYPDCRDAAENIRKEVDRLATDLMTDPASGRWGWRAELDDEPVANCQRWFDRERTCRTSLAKFLESLPTAEFAADVAPLRDRSNPDAVRLAAGGKT